MVCVTSRVKGRHIAESAFLKVALKTLAYERCAECQRILDENCRQCPCGDRLCGSCYDNLSSAKAKSVCRQCQTEFQLSECFRDKAAARELENSLLKCDNPNCSWEGNSEDYKEHFATCCAKVPASVSSTSPPKCCVYVYENKTSRPKFSAAEAGCKYLSVKDDDTDDHKVGSNCHIFYTAASGHSESKSSAVHAGEFVAGTQQSSDRSSDVSREVSQQLQPMATAVAKNESAIQHLQGEMIDGIFLWKIPDVRKRVREAMMDETVSPHSAFFYTGRYGYRMCLRLYLNGDGTGKGTHLSFFFVIMKGDYDKVLPWPFKQPVTLMLLDQDKEVVKNNIVQTFKPTPDSSSFQQPVNEMNVAYGCPKFAPLAVLDNPSYMKEDIMFLKCKIDTSSLCD